MLSLQAKNQLRREDGEAAISKAGSVLVASRVVCDGEIKFSTTTPERVVIRISLRSEPVHVAGNDAHKTWSPDGKWIVFTSARGGFKDESALHPYNPQPYGDIYVMRADGSDVRRLTDNQYEEGTPSLVTTR